MINTTSIARSIAMNAVLNCGLPSKEFVVDDVDSHSAPYQGVMIYAVANLDRVVHVYLCDDDKGSELWMLDATNVMTGSVDPRPLTAEFLQFCLEWLTADAWMMVDTAGGTSISTDYDWAWQQPYDRRFPLNGVPRGNLLAWLDPTTGDLASDELKNLSAVHGRFTKPLYCAMEK